MGDGRWEWEWEWEWQMEASLRELGDWEWQHSHAPQRCHLPSPISHVPFPISHFPFPISHFPFPICSGTPTPTPPTPADTLAATPPCHPVDAPWRTTLPSVHRARLPRTA